MIADRPATLALEEMLLALGQQLLSDGYQFITPTPSTHSRVLARQRPATTLQDIFGWNKSFQSGDMPSSYRRYLENDEILEPTPEGYRAKVRFSSLDSLLLAHSGYPTTERDAVFFGPDTYRFASGIKALKQREPSFSPKTCFDIGSGSGAGGLFCATVFDQLETVELLDINDRALAFSRVNARLNGLAHAQSRKSDVLLDAPGSADLIISNPPYLVDRDKRNYRHGGGNWGTALSERIVDEALARLSPEGQFLLYTGTPIVGGRDVFKERLAPLLKERTRAFTYEVMDPDVFGEKLEKPPYDEADRIAIVLLNVNGSNLKR